jgi:hypothetical protein
MSSRFGRKKRRADRAVIVELEKNNRRLKAAEEDARMRAFSAENKLHEAAAIAFENFAKQRGYIDSIMRQASQRMADKFSEEILPYAKKIMEADHRREPIRFAALNEWRSADITRIRIEIPAICCEFALTQGF